MNAISRQWANFQRVGQSCGLVAADRCGRAIPITTASAYCVHATFDQLMVVW
jgi:hypothetical protein